MSQNVPAAIKTVCVYCGSAVGNRPEFSAAAAALGRELAMRSIGIVYGGGQVGLMGIVADAALEHDGPVIGVIPDRLATEELTHQRCTEMHVVPDMHARKALMADFADAFVALPGGIGTFEELFEAATWQQIGYHNKPVHVIDVGGFYQPLRNLLSEAERDGFLRTKGGRHPQPIEFVNNVDEYIAAIASTDRSG